jgi:hypothetical protein
MRGPTGILKISGHNIGLRIHIQIRITETNKICGSEYEKNLGIHKKTSDNKTKLSNVLYIRGSCQEILFNIGKR